MAIRFERLLNAAETTTNETLDDSETVITVTDGSVFPATGDYRLLIEDEVVLVTSRATDDLTVVRGADDTTAVAHSTGLTIKTVITRDAIKRYVQDFIRPQAFDAIPDRLLNIDGVTLTKSSFTELNLGTGTLTDDNDGGMTIAMQNRSSPNLNVLYKTAPSTPYTVTVHLLNGIGGNQLADNANVLGFRESGTGKMSFISFHPAGVVTGKVFAQYLDNPTTSGPGSTANEEIGSRYDIWLRVEHDGTNLKYHYSYDGVTFRQLRTESKTFHFDVDANQVFWGTDCQGVDGHLHHLKAWAEE